MEFNLQELQDIYRTYEAYGIIDTPVIYKILQKYTYCHMCNSLILNKHWEEHYQKEFEREYP